MTILGIDISKWDGNWDASKAKQAGATFVFIKASQATFADPQFQANWQKAKDAGLIRGAYHYLDYTKSGVDQANFFADLLKNDPGELPPVIDYELRRTDNNPSAAIGFLRDCLDQLIQRTELFENMSLKRPMIYTGPGFWLEYGDQTKSEYWIQFPLWNGHWISSNTPKIPAPWTMWQFWQFTSKGPGEAFGSECLSMDMNRFNGTLNELMEFAGIRIPVVNLNEKFESLDDRVKLLENIVTTLKQSGEVTNSGTLARLDELTSHLANLDGSFTACSSAINQRIAAIEQMVGSPANLSSFHPIQTGLSTGVANPADPPSPDPGLTDVPVTIPVPAEVPADLSGKIDPPSDMSGISDPTPTVPTPSYTSAGSVKYATCITTALNVRSGPGASFPTTNVLRYGQQVKVINRQSGWAQFQDPDGWSSEAYLSFEQNSPAAQDNNQPAVGSFSFGICNTSGLNIRSGPGVTNPIVGGLTYGQRIKILSHKAGWAQIETPTGWCNESYLSFA